MSNPPLLQAAIAAHRFGLGEPTLEPLAADPQGWLLAQIGPAEPARGSGLLSTRDGLRLVAAEREKRQAAQNPPPGMTAEQLLAGHYRDANVADARSHLASAAFGTRPFMERLQLFWANHFTVSLAKGSARGLVGAFERDAIRPNLNGSFETLLHAATTHPAMLRYLDNSQSAGPHSAVRRPRAPARRADRRGGARDRPEREPGARSARAAHARRDERARRGRRRRLHAGRRDRVRRGADRLAGRPGRGRCGIAVRSGLARAGPEGRARQALPGRARRARRGSPRPRRPSGDRPLRRDQAGAPLRRRRTAAGAGRAADGGLRAEQRRPADALPRAGAQSRGLGRRRSAS